MISKSIIAWVDPLEFAQAISEKHWVLLYSGVRNVYSGRYSFLGCGLKRTISGDDFIEFSKVLSSNKNQFENAWFGYLGYGLKDSLENLTNDQKGKFDLPELLMMQFSNIYLFDHDEKVLTLFSEDSHCEKQGDKDWIASPLANNEAINITSNMSKAEYIEKVAHIVDCINAGDLYQANLTRKFYGEFVQTPDYFQLFKKLCAASPASYSAFMRIDENYILSSSPELFLKLDAYGNITTRPIKGTQKRGADKESDAALKTELQNSEKDRAENIMIVDLMRNDLAKSCEIGSVKTDKLFEVTTHATIHHLSSNISGLKRNDCTIIDVVRECFPAGSMTGTPKITAMNLCSKLEQQERGVYSGSIGWFGGDGECELSVVIRTIIACGNKFEFQVGGGIVADSTPEKEWQETIEKAKGMLLALDIKTEIIEQL